MHLWMVPVSAVVTILVGIAIAGLRLTTPMTLDELFERIPAGEIDVLSRICEARMYHILADGIDERSHCSLVGPTQKLVLKGELHRGRLEAFFDNGALVSWEINGKDIPLGKTAYREKSMMETILTRVMIAIEKQEPLPKGA